MTNAELKDSIINNTLSTDFLILQVSNSDLIANQYTQAIAQANDLEIQFIDSLTDIDSYKSCLDVYCPYLFVLHTDNFTEIRTDYSELENVIVICATVDKKLLKTVEPFIVKLDKTEPWQVQDYIEVRCSGLSEQDRVDLYQITQGNIDRIESICDQISLFEPDEQTDILAQLRTTTGTDLYFNTAFNLVDAIVAVLLNRDLSANMDTIHDILVHRNCCDLTALYVNTILLTKLRNIAIICHGGNVKASDFLNKDGKPMSDKQFYFFKRAFAVNATTEHLVAAKLAKAIKFSASIDSDLKLGRLEFSSDSYLLDYIIVNILSC